MMPAAQWRSPGQVLGSIALRYRQPLSEGRGPDSAHVRFGVNHPLWGGMESRDTSNEEIRSRSIKLANLESVLFLAREPLGSRKLALLSGLADGTEARTLVRALNRLYDGEGSSFRVVEVAGGFQLLSRGKFSPWLRRLQVVPAEVRLSAPALETLAVVAYRQPVLRADIEAIRGVQGGEILRQLMERGLVRIVGKSEELGRPFLYGTTRWFLQVFGLRDLDELPRPAWQRPDVPRADASDHAALQATPETSREATSENCEMLNQPIGFNNPGGDPIVKTLSDPKSVWQDDIESPVVAQCPSHSRLVAGRDEPGAEDDDFDDEEFDDEDEDYEEEEEEEEDEEDLDDEEEEFDDEDFEDSEWEEVEDDEEDEEVEEDEDLDEEDEDWDEEDEDEDWEDEDEEWEDEDEE